MTKRLDLPPELELLIEKRELEDRRQPENAEAEHDASEAAPPREERRSQQDRRAT